MSKKVSIITTMVLLFLAFPIDIFAHKIGIVSWFHEDILHIESSFNCGEKVQHGNVKVFDSAGRIILTGTTDQNGCFSFRVTQLEDLKITITTPCGHKNFLKVSSDELKDTTTSTNIVSDNSFSDILKKSEAQDLVLDQIELIISRQLNDKLQPIIRDIAYGKENKITWHDILGGIGYIIGLIGMGAYFKHTRT